MNACIGDNKKWPTATKYYCRPSSETTCHALHVAKSCQMKDSEMMCLAEEEHAMRLGIFIEDVWKRTLNRLDSYPYNDHKIWRMASAKAENIMPEEIREIKDNPWMPEYNRPDYPKDNFFTDDLDLANLNTKLCDHCLIPCHFQYCNKCDFMFNLPPRILFPITKLPEPKEEVLITKDMSFQDPTEDTKTEQYLTYSNLFKELELKWYNNNKKRICPKRVHDTDTSFDLQ
ncbi:hypothetical protein G9A89_020528 [Geosiphon pyriformis]|nr:hypothetical protein G9A89_020528 [Geosiphon pyriformis]